MQQTETYKLNKPGPDDPVAIAPLNENADTLEAALISLDAAAADLDQRVQLLELHRIAVGTYQANTIDNQLIELGFTPKAVIVALDFAMTVHAMATVEHPLYNNNNHNSLDLQVEENGFRVWHTLNSAAHVYNYLALA